MKITTLTQAAATMQKARMRNMLPPQFPAAARSLASRIMRPCCFRKAAVIIPISEWRLNLRQITRLQSKA